MKTDSEDALSDLRIPDFWDRIASSRETFLGLDYDGTLAPFRVERMDALPEPGIPRLLDEISRSTKTDLVIISGRPVSELATLLGSVSCMLVGSHGFETMSPDGTHSFRNPDALQGRGLALAEEIGEKEGLGKRLEVKIASVALHTRGLSPEDARALQDRFCEQWNALREFHDLEIRRFNGGIELRSRGWDKGEVLLGVLQTKPEGTFSVYIGDDDTDEDAFRVIRDRGIGIKVGVPSRDTAARGFLHDIPEVKVFLETWLAYAPRKK
ncbi:MAG: trehalose-phosphatase [Desulfomonilia bacterium]